MRPVIEKKKLEVRHLIYILIITICIIAIGIAVYMQFFKDEKLGVIFGITKEQDDEEYKKMKENFLNIFDNGLNIVESYQGNIEKIRKDDDVIILGDNIQEQKENYTLDLKIPYFNINSNLARRV
jgi:hypothetical protein